MTSPRRLLLCLLPLLLIAWSACPCIYSRWLADAQGDDTSIEACECPCCSIEEEQPQKSPGAPEPCERRSARNADLPPAAPELFVDQAEAPLFAAADPCVSQPMAHALAGHEVIPAPPDVLRRGTVLLN